MSGGFTIVDVPDLDGAIAIVKEWPSLQYLGVAVEVRPIVDHSLYVNAALDSTHRQPSAEDTALAGIVRR
jgi:hypothetical protein